MRPVEYARLKQAIEQFTSQPTAQLPEGVLQKVKEVSEMLDEQSPTPPSPGMRQARELAGGGDEAVASVASPLSKLSPGQRAARGDNGLSKDLADAAAKIVEEHGGAGAQGGS